MFYNYKKGQKILIMILFIYCFLVPSIIANEISKPLKIAHFYSDTIGFWPLSTAFAAAAAEDLNVEFDSYSFGNSPLVQIELIKKVLNDPKTKPDGFLFHNYKNRADQILKIAKDANVPAVMFNTGPKEDSSFGNPREKYPLYLALITPDDEKAGYDLAIYLIKEARKKALYGQDGKIHMCILEGSRFSSAAQLRKKGLLRALKENKDIVVDQFFDTNWRKERAKDAFSVTVKRYPQSKVFWAASDLMAIGIIEKAKSFHKKPGVDLITGGIDLLPSIQPKVLAQEIAVSIGAHYTESIWALVLLHDYLKGCTKVQQNESPIFKSTMISLHSYDKAILPKETKEDILQWAQGIDFSKYSKCFSQTEYSFDSNQFFK